MDDIGHDDICWDSDIGLESTGPSRVSCLFRWIIKKALASKSRLNNVTHQQDQWHSLFPLVDTI